MANLTNSSNIIDEINSKLDNPEWWTDWQILTMKNSWGRYPQPQWTTPDFWDVKYNDFKFYTADAQDMASWVLLRPSTFIDTPTANFVINAPIHMEDTMYHDWFVYTLRVKNWNTAYTMTLGEWITNPWDTDVTLTPNAIDQFVFLAVDWVLELQPEAGGGEWWESPNTVKLFTMPSEWDNISGIVEHLTNWGQIVLQDEFDIYQSTFFEEWTITVSLVWVNSITNININYDWSNVVESITVIDSNFGPSPEVVTEVPSEYVSGKVYFVVDWGVKLMDKTELTALWSMVAIVNELNKDPEWYFEFFNAVTPEWLNIYLDFDATRLILQTSWAAHQLWDRFYPYTDPDWYNALAYNPQTNIWSRISTWWPM